MPCFSCLRTAEKASEQPASDLKTDEAPDKEADACPENVGREDIKAARHLASKLGLKKPPKLPKQQPNNSDSAKSKPRNGRQSPKSSRSKNGRSKTPEKAHGPVKGHQPNAEAKKQPRNNNNPAFLAVQPDRTAQPVFANGRMANGSAAAHIPEEEPLGKARLSPDLEHNSPPSFQGFLTEQQKMEELAQSEGDIMDSQDIWTPRKKGSWQSSSGSLNHNEKFKQTFRQPANNHSAAPMLQNRAQPSDGTSSSLEKAEVGRAARFLNADSSYSPPSPRGGELAEAPPASFVASLANRSRTSSVDSVFKPPDRQQPLASISSESSVPSRPGALRLPEASRSGYSPTRRSSLSAASRTSSIGNESPREADSGASPLQLTRSGSLSGSPHDPGQAGADLYELVGQLAVGRTGTTKLMRDRRTNELVAAKWVQHTAGETLSVQTEREIVNHRRLLHPNVVRFREVFATDEHLVIVMDYASVGHLSERIATGGALMEIKAKEFYRQLVDGMIYCHKQGIVHRNLRMENMLLDGQYFRPVLKISGFGYSKAPDLDSAPKTLELGSPTYSPPEMLFGSRTEGYDGFFISPLLAEPIFDGIVGWFRPQNALCEEQAGDVHSLSIPKKKDASEPGILSRRLIQRIANCLYEFPAGLTLSRECKDLLAQIFVANPRNRIDSYAVPNHPWLSGTELPKAEPVVISKQSESDISFVMDRARKRRAARDAAQRKQAQLPGLFNEDLLDD